ncbi:hypothetical protein PV326_005497 [Microctonus aethiopoides]|nr:hypothetical protein PV326_005497 [Microctonus aethiopoides]
MANTMENRDSNREANIAMEKQHAAIWVVAMSTTKWNSIFTNAVQSTGVNVINLRRTYENILLAARAIITIEHPSEVFVISSRPHGQRAILKFAAYTGATPIAGRFTPGAFTNQIQAA